MSQVAHFQQLKQLQNRRQPSKSWYCEIRFCSPVISQLQKSVGNCGSYPSLADRISLTSVSVYLRVTLGMIRLVIGLDVNSRYGLLVV
jgi:hypothetical protein